MKMITIFSAFLLIASGYTSAGVVRYDGYQLLQAVPNNEYQLELLKNLEKETRGVLDFWRYPVILSYPVDILVPPMWIDYVKYYILLHGIEFETTVRDVQQLIDSQEILRQRSLTSGVANFDFNVYHTIGEISQWINDFSDKNNKLVSVFDVTRSYEGRSIRGLKLGMADENDVGKPAVYLQGGIHAREWIAPATVINICNKLVRGYGVDYTVTHLLDTFDYYIVPLLNVDGYSYTHSEDRLWRKNRSPNRYSSCIGTDLNRNYPNHWDEEGGNSDECDPCYRGEYESSELEIQGIVNFLLEVKASGTEFISFVDFHSYSQMLLYPWAYSAQANPPPDFSDQEEAAVDGADALSSVYGTVYTHGPVSKLLYSSPGCSLDWGYENLGAKYSYAVELRDTGVYGFLLPEDQIEPTGVETFEFIKSLGDRLLKELQRMDA